MNGNTRGDGPYTHGNSFACGSLLPSWARGWEFRVLQEAQADRWKVQP